MTDYATRLSEIGIILKERFKGAKLHHQLQCVNCQHEWTATPVSKMQSFKKTGRNGCPNCYQKQREMQLEQTRQAFIDKITSKGIKILDEPYNGSQTTSDKIKVLFEACGHVCEIAPGNIVHRNVGCTQCAAELRASQNRQRNDDKHNVWASQAGEWEVYKQEVTSRTYHLMQQYGTIINPNKHPIMLAGQDGFQVDHIFPVRRGFDLGIPSELIAHVENLQVIPWRANLFHKDKSKGKVPAHILAAGFDIEHHLLHLFCQLMPSAKALYQYQATNAFELASDIAVIIATDEHLSPVWDNTKGRFKLLDQQTELLQYYKRVIVITMDELVNNPTLIRRKLEYLTKNIDATRIHARQCQLRIIEAKEKNAFLNVNHVQGSDTSAINIGAFYKDHLIAVMTFCKPRVLMGKKTQVDGEWELSRFATDVNYRIPGIASKMLSWFERSTKWSQIYSYADVRWSDGNVYEQLNFTRVITNKPAYWYVDGTTRKHRWGFRKDILKSMQGFDATKTEYQNVAALLPSYQRLYDCGTILYQRINCNKMTN